jgi:CO/xanthine dehydrogenase Mo-binding subunit
MTTQNNEFGRSIPRLEARQKVSGTAEYIHHFTVSGMLYGKIFRSTIAHGKILKIYTDQAKSYPGVYAVLTGEDIQKLIPSPYYGPAFLDQPILAIEKVHFIGEPVALVLSTNPHIAEAATQLIDVDYEELDAVFDEIEALNSEAIVHHELKPSGTFPDLKHLIGRKNTNIALDYHLRYGNAEDVFSHAKNVFEHTFTTQQAMHTPLEPMVSVAIPGDQNITIHSATQMPSFVRLEIARLLGWRENQVRVKSAHLGGGYGAKVYIKLEALVTAAALILDRPVKVSLTMEEQFYTISKHATTFKIKSATDSNGKILARDCKVYWNGGAYADIGPRVAQKSGFTAAGPYAIEHVSIDSFEIYTNLPPAGALRGFGIPQLVWAYESHTDMIAHELGLDPFEFRKKNLLVNGLKQATGTVIQNMESNLVLETLFQKMDWSSPFDKGTTQIRKGRGIAIGFKASVSPTTSTATITIHGDGSCLLSMSTVDMGQGSDTAMAQIAAETLSIPTEQIKVIRPDTDITPYDMGTLGSRSTFHMGNAVKLAAQDVLNKLKSMASQAGLDANTTYSPHIILQKTYGMQAGTIVGFGSYKPSYIPTDLNTGASTNVTPFWMVGATGIELEVDIETGHMHITKMINVVDAGDLVNPKIAITQVSGAAIMQCGFTFSEEMIFDAGQLINGSFADYKIPGIQDVNFSMENICVSAIHDQGPFGAKGIGESGTFGVSPAVANALFDAIGVRITSLPITPEKVFQAIQKKSLSK